MEKMAATVLAVMKLALAITEKLPVLCPRPSTGSMG